MTEERQSWTPDVFDRLYEASDDPWDFRSSPYETAKYAATLEALGARHFASAFEVGCSIGVLTRQLAPRCEALLAVDVAKAALALARGTCSALPHVQFAEMQVPGEWPAEKFDLILLSEVLYFLDPKDIARVAARVCETLLPEGLVLLVNWTGPNEAPCSGEQAADLFRHAAGARLKQVLLRREPGYRLDLLRC